MARPSSPTSEDSSPPAGAETGGRRRRRALLLAGLLVLATVLAYWRSFQGVFQLDDVANIERVLLGFGGESPPVRSDFLRYMQAIPYNRRPLTDWTLFLNHRLGGMDPFGYHVLNLVVHLAAVGLLFALVRRTLRLPKLEARFRGVATPLAFGAALLWALHPLNTQAVTYVVQRGESLMALFYLATLYALLRSASARSGAALWVAAAWLAGLLGMASKEVMISAPLAVLAFDAVFLAGWFPSTRARRVVLHTGLWLAVAAFSFLSGTLTDVFNADPTRAVDVGLGVEGVRWYEYLYTQCQVIPHYLRLAFWPTGQVFDYGPWPWVTDWREAVAGALFLSLLFLGGLVGVVRRRASGFLLFAFFLILAPTSSVIKIVDPAFEHRMYLPLAAVVVLSVTGLYTFAQRTFRDGPSAARTVLGLCAVLALVLGAATHARNALYLSQEAMWSDVVAKRPDHPRALTNLSVAQTAEGFSAEKLPGAVDAARKAVQLAPGDAGHHYNLGLALERSGDSEGAIASYSQAIALRNDYAEAYANLGQLLYVATGEANQATQYLQVAKRIDPSIPEVHFNLGFIQQGLGNLDQAIAFYDETLAIDPGYHDAAIMKALCQEQLGRLSEAEASLRTALPGAIATADDEALVKIHTNLGTVLFLLDRLVEAREEYSQAIAVDPQAHVTWHNLGLVQESLGDLGAARESYQRALAINPRYQPAGADLKRLEN